MAYNVTLSNGSTIVTIPDGAVFNTYSVPLVGQNTSAYGDDVAAAFLRSLENFAFTSPPDTNPNIPGSVKLTGQLWYDTSTAALKVYDGAAWNSLLTSGSGLDSVAQDLLPATDSTYDIGAVGLRWQDTYTDNLTFGGTFTAEAGSSMTTSGTFTADGASTVDLNGTVTIAGATFDGKLVLDTAVDGIASLQIPQAGAINGATMSTGDMWIESDGVHVVIAGVEQVLGVVGPAGGVTSFNTRSGPVVSEADDYSDPTLTGGKLNVYPRKDGAGGTQDILSGNTWDFQNRPSFTGGTSGVDSPFTVDSTFMVTNLNAQYIDDSGTPRAASYFAADADVVKLTGDQPVAGIKTFSSTINADAAATSGEGVRVRGTSTTATTNRAYVSFYESDNSTLVGRVGITDNTTADFYVSAHTGNLRLWAQDTTATSEIVELTTAGMGVFTSTGTELLEVALPGTGESGSLRFRGPDGIMRNAGFNETFETVVSGVPFIVSTNHIGSFLTRTGPANTDVQVNNNLANFPIGASFMVHNDNSTGVMRVIEGTSVTLQWVDGSGSAPLTGARTIAYNGVATVRKKSTGVYQIWGTGIS